MADLGPIVLAIDQGTSSTKAVAVAADGAFLAKEVLPVGQQHPRPGWVEQNADELFATVATALRRLWDGAASRPVSIGLSTQRESAVVWERSTGKPLGPMLGWQDRRTAPRARALLETGHGPLARATTGLPIDPMFSALKFAWLLDSVDPDRRQSRSGELALGTVDSYLVHRLTGHHQIEVGNASRTLLMDIDSATWSPDLLELFDIPEAALPRIVPSDERTPLLGSSAFGGRSIDAVLGDSHAALYGHGARRPGDVKVTYGTGSSVMGLLAPGAAVGEALARTVAWQTDAAAPVHAFEGNILATGATLVWLASVLGTTPTGLMDLAADVDPLHGVDLVPAFAGLGAPWWSETAKAGLTGFTLGTSREVVARAAVDSIVLQVEDVLTAAEADGADVHEVLLDGGPSANDRLVQLQADLSQRRVRRSSIPELSALGAAELAAATAGVPFERRSAADRTTAFTPRLPPSVAAQRRSSWNEALGTALGRPVHHPADVAVRT